jgi:hypothetical protein
MCVSGPWCEGKALNKSMDELVVNALGYYLSLREIESEESY